jgi:hypothetical protein
MHVLIHPHISSSGGRQRCVAIVAVFSPAKADRSSIRCTLSWICLRNHQKKTLWLFNIAMENGTFIWFTGVYLLKMVIFYGYVK